MTVGNCLKISLTLHFLLLLSGCLHIPTAHEKCDLQCYGLEVVDDKWCWGVFNYNSCQEVKN